MISTHFQTAIYPPPVQVLLPTLVCVAHGNGHICDSLSPHLSLRWLMQATEQSHPPAAAVTNAVDLGTRERKAGVTAVTAGAASASAATSGASSHQSPALSPGSAAAALRRPALLLDRVCALMGTGPPGYSIGSNSLSSGGNSSIGQISVSAGQPAVEEGADSALPQLLAYSNLSSRFPVALLPEARSFFLRHCCQQKSSGSV